MLCMGLVLGGKSRSTRLKNRVVDLPVRRQPEPGQTSRLCEEFNTITHKCRPFGCHLLFQKPRAFYYLSAQVKSY